MGDPSPRPLCFDAPQEGDGRRLARASPDLPGSSRTGARRRTGPARRCDAARRHRAPFVRKCAPTGWAPDRERRRVRRPEDLPPSYRPERDLPPGYRLAEDPELLVLLRRDGSEVATFSAQGADPLEVVAAAWVDSE